MALRALHDPPGTLGGSLFKIHNMGKHSVIGCKPRSAAAAVALVVLGMHKKLSGGDMSSTSDTLVEYLHAEP